MTERSEADERKEAVTELLPGEGDTKTETYRRVRRECDECGEAATHRLAFLYENARSNPASSGYRGDDISWCSDAEAWSCDAHKETVRRAAPRGMEWCASFTLAAGRANMFLHWQEVSDAHA